MCMVRRLQRDGAGVAGLLFIVCAFHEAAVERGLALKAAVATADSIFLDT